MKSKRRRGRGAPVRCMAEGIARMVLRRSNEGKCLMRMAINESFLIAAR